MKEKIIIVNEKDEQIGVKERGEVEQKDIYRVSALWVTNSKGEILLARRGFNKKNNPGKWGPAVAGTIDEGETYEENIYKEAEEEIGLTGVKFVFGKKVKRIEPNRAHNYFTQYFHIMVDKEISEFVIQEEELAGLKWFSKKELESEIKKNPDNFLQVVREIVNGEVEI